MDWIIFWHDIDKEIFRGTFAECWNEWIKRSKPFANKFMRNIVLKKGYVSCLYLSLCRVDLKDKHFKIVKREDEIW